MTAAHSLQPSNNANMLTEEEEANIQKHQHNPYFVHDDTQSHDTTNLQDNKKWRVSFLDLHNSNPKKLAKTIYPEGIIFNNNDEYSKYYDPNRVARGEHNKYKYTSTNVFRALTNYFIEDMSTMGLSLTVAKTRTKHWHPDFTACKSYVPVPSYKPSSHIQFYCPKCIDNKRFGLVANGKFIGGDPVSKESISNLSMEIVELFYHSIDCSEETRPDAHTNYMDIGYTRINACFNWVFGDRYEKLVDKIENDTVKATPHFSPSMTKDEIKQWKAKNKRIKVLQKDDNWRSFGVLANAKNKIYKYDDRSQLLLPGNPVDQQIQATTHYISMARLMYRIVAALGIQEEFSPYLFDEEAMLKVWDNEKTAPNRSHIGKYKDNHVCHLKLKEVSALFGGNERQICGTEPIHQFCHHIDRANKGSPNKGKFAPGTIIVPISTQGTSIYIRQPENLIPIPFGYLLLLKTGIPHGGITRRHNQREQQVSICGHLDSKNFKRKTDLSLTHIRSCYAPPQHYKLCSAIDHISAIVDHKNVLETMIKYFWQHRKDDFEKAKQSKNSKRAIAIIKEFEKLPKGENSQSHNKKRKQNQQPNENH